MDRGLVVLIVSVLLCGCGPSDPQPTPLKTDVVQCPAALFLIQAPEGMPALELDFGLSDMEFREHVAELLGNDTCRFERVAICLPRPIEVEGAIITKVRAKLGFRCDKEATDSKQRVSILVNRAGQILCEGELVLLEQVPECYRSTFASTASDDWWFGGLDLDWSRADASVISEIISGSGQEHWAHLKEYVSRNRGVQICRLGEEELRDLAVPFEVQLLYRPVPPTTTVTSINAPTIFWEKVEPNDSL